MISVRVESFSELLEKINSLPSRDERISSLKRLPNSIIEFLKFTFDPSISIKIDVNKLNYRPIPYTDGLEAGLYRAVRSLYVFLGDNNPMKQQLFERMLETVPASDAQLLIGMVNKKLEYSNINLALLSDSFPDMFPKTLDFAEAVNKPEPAVVVNKPVEPVKKVFEINPKLKQVCELCGKESPHFGTLLFHMRKTHKFTNEQVDELRAKRAKSLES